jgi:formylglycine-generating enzyme required for sulfatase activity
VKAKPVAGLNPLTASKEQPYVNELGMRFVPVVKFPTGVRVLFSIWETRVQDYALYAEANVAVDPRWKDQTFEGFRQEADHAVVAVSWDDARTYCAWLTRKEQAAGRIRDVDEYRLPTDLEWSYAVGIAALEDGGATAAQKYGKLLDVYPWGAQWPPPPGAGNFRGAEGVGDFRAPESAGVVNRISGYRDDFPFTAPAGSGRPNSLGIYNLSGNVSEWCEDRYSDLDRRRLLRGGSWVSGTTFYLSSSSRDFVQPEVRAANYGFRIALALGSEF